MAAMPATRVNLLELMDPLGFEPVRRAKHGLKTKLCQRASTVLGWTRILGDAAGGRLVLIGMIARRILGAAALSASLPTAFAASAQPAAWMDTALSPDRRATLLEHAMTLEEKIALLHGHAPLAMR